MKVRNGERGFTLVESLLALALFALILGSFGALFKSSRTTAFKAATLSYSPLV